MNEKLSKTVRSTQLHGASFAQKLGRGCHLLLLKGSLGAGKTEWVRGFVRGRFKDKRAVSSPSYSIVNIYGMNQKKIFHVDLFRLKSADDLESIGFWDFLTGQNTVIVEWGDKCPPLFPDSVKVFEISIEIKSETQRMIAVRKIEKMPL